jgi:hypothetical protein
MHKDDPNSVASTFGPAGAWFGGTSISYPWQTPMENEHKHSVYGWIVRDQLPNYANQPTYIRAFRSQAHFVGSGGLFPSGMRGGFQSQFHSFSLEAEVCNQANAICGIVRLGGWVDFGHGDIETAPLAGSTQPVAICLTPNIYATPPDQQCLDSSRRLHGSTIDSTRMSEATWYGANNKFHRTGEALSIDFGIIGESWAPVNPVNLDELAFYDPENLNGSWLSQEILGIVIEPWWVGANGRVNRSGHTDRYGNFHTQPCAPMGPDCVPYSIQNVPPGVVQYRDSNANRSAPDHDVRDPSTGKTLLRYPS